MLPPRAVEGVIVSGVENVMGDIYNAMFTMMCKHCGFDDREPSRGAKDDKEKRYLAYHVILSAVRREESL
jgi:hypothetical protein